MMMRFCRREKVDAQEGRKNKDKMNSEEDEKVQENVSIKIECKTVWLF